MPFTIGQLTLDSNLFLSPLAGYTNLPFRLIIREIGGVGLCTTDLVNARSLLEKNRKALELIRSCPEDRPLAVQLYGRVPEEMRDAAALLESLGVSSVDINMGCPVRKICRSGSGSKLMDDHDKAARLVGLMVGAVKIPVTAKMRLGWDDENLTAPDLARALEGVGVAAIAVHGRTRQQGFSGSANLAGIRAVVQAVRRVPIIGNGDITTPQAAKRMFDQTSCAAISIGRGAFYNPWIFRHIQYYLLATRHGTDEPAPISTSGSPTRPFRAARPDSESGCPRVQEPQTQADQQVGPTGEPELPPEPTFEERVAVMKRHLDLMVGIFGEARGCRMFRKIALQYARPFGPTKEFHKRIVRLATRAEFDDILAAYRIWRAQFLDDNQRLLPQYQPKHLDLATEDSDKLKVPSGPNELW